MDCLEAKSLISRFSLINDCDVIKNGALRMSLPFQHLDGSYIDLFLQRNAADQWVLSDLGNTAAYLLDLHVKPWSSQKRMQVVADICKSLKIEQVKGQLQAVLTEAQLRKELPEAMVRLSQACIRVSDLALTRRLRTPVVFQDEMEEFLSVADLDFDKNVLLAGQFGNKVEVNFAVRGKSVSSLVQTLSTANSAAAHNLSNEVFRRWYDLSNHRPKNQFVTVYDTNTDYFRDEDLKRIATLSSIFGFPAEEDQIREALAA